MALIALFIQPVSAVLAGRLAHSSDIMTSKLGMGSVLESLAVYPVARIGIFCFDARPPVGAGTPFQLSLAGRLGNVLVILCRGKPMICSND